MKNRLLYTVLSLIIGGMVFTACDETDIDVFPDGWDTNKSDRSDVDIDTIGGIDVSKYHQARIFPGLVDTLTEVRIDASIVLDLSKPFVTRKEYGLDRSFSQGGEVELMPHPIFSTGLFAGAGELVKIEVTDPDVRGLTVQIGQHTDDLSKLSSYFREPVAYTRKTLYPGTNYVRFPLGGYIWIIRDDKMIGPENLTLNFKGVYKAHDFIKDQTDPEQWVAQLKATTVPWLELLGEHVAISVDRQRILEKIENNKDFATRLNRQLELLDHFFEYFYESKGILPDAESSSDRLPAHQERFVFDVQLLNNVAMHASNPQAIMMLKTSKLYDELTSWDNMVNAYFPSVFAALKNKYNISAVASDWRNAIAEIPLYRVAKDMYDAGYATTFPDGGADMTKDLNLSMAFAAADSAKRESNLKEVSMPTTYMLSQLAEFDRALGKQPFDILNGILFTARKGSSVADASYLQKALCDEYQLNLTPFFENWGLEMTEADREYARKYDLPQKQIWKINLLTRNTPIETLPSFDAAKFAHRHNRSNWTALAVDSAYIHNNEDIEGYKVENEMHKVVNLFDGKSSTYWASYVAPEDRNLGGRPNKYPLPFYIIIDMGEELDADGVYFVNGPTKTVSKFRVQTTTATGFQLDDTSVEWHDALSLNQTFASPYNEQFMEFPSRIHARYLRIVIDELNLNATVFNQWEPEDQERALRLNSLRFQEFAEFGTYYFKR